MNRKLMGALLCLGAIHFSLSGQVFTTLHSFSNTPDGANPGGLAVANGLIYGTTQNGGAYGNGCVFTYRTNDSTFTKLFDFPADLGASISPNRVLVASNVIYGATQHGGTNVSQNGMVYALGTNGAGFASRYSFGSPPDGALPNPLILAGPTLYGTANNGGTNGDGTIFKINTNGAGYATLHWFTNAPDGASPQNALVLGGAMLYGTTAYGGSAGKGTIFAINTNGAGYTILHTFTNAPDGAYPYCGLVLTNGILYGISSSGGAYTNGAIFAINTNGTGFHVLYSFSGFVSNLDGAVPKASLTLSGNGLYGTTVTGGAGNGGTLFFIDTNGTGFSVIASFTNSGAASGSDLQSGVVRAGNALWGTTGQDGVGGFGTLFEVPLPAITAPPQSLTVTDQTPASLAVTAVDDIHISYQWYFNTNTALARQTNSTLTFANADPTNSGFYTLVASDSFGSVTSQVAQLTVISLAPVITEQPQSLSVLNGDSATFSSVASGGGVLAYQWFFGTNTTTVHNVLLTGATDPTLVLTNAITNLAGAYSVRVQNSYGAVTSSFALLSVSNGLNLLSFDVNATNGSASLALANIAKSTNRLWASTNLLAWRVIATNVMATNGLWFFTETNSARTNSARFFRFSTP